MFGVPFYFASLILLALWLWKGRQAPFWRLLFYWWAGLVLVRAVPPFASAWLARVIGPESRVAGSAVAFLLWLGALLLLRGVLGLALLGRSFGRGTKFALGLFVLALLPAAAMGTSAIAVVVPLSIPLLGSVRWRKQRSAVALVVATLTALVSFLISGVNWSVDTALTSYPESGAHVTLASVSIGVGVVYGAIALIGAASYIHLSIRSVGRRLVVSHLLAGFVPFVVCILFLLLAGSLYLSSYRGLVATRYLQHASEDARARITRSLAETGRVPEDPLGLGVNGTRVFIAAADSVEATGAPVAFEPAALFASPDAQVDVPLLWDREVLYLRARVDVQRDGREVRYEALAPIDSADVVRLGGIIGTPLQLTPTLSVSRTNRGIQIGGEDEVSDEGTPGEVDEEAQSVAPAAVDSSITEDLLDDEGGASNEEHRPMLGTPVTAAWRLPGGSVVPCLRWRDEGFVRSDVPVLANASFFEIVSALFAVSKQNPLATVALIALAFLAFILIGAVALATKMVVTMLRSVTRSVGALKRATAAIGEGKLDHRIQVEGKDELWSVASSFNEMAAGLEHMRAMELENERLEQELVLAREIQHRLLPEAAPVLADFEIAGTSRSAREVGGDYYDYLELDGGRIAIAVADVSGKGAAAALLMSSFRASLRSHDVADLGPASTLVRLNRFVHGSVTPGKFITAFLGVLDPRTGEMTYACAGHEPPIVVADDGTVSTLGEGGPPLGLLPEVSYEDARASLTPRSLFAVFTDGVTEAQNAAGEFYGELLLSTLQGHHDEPAKALVDHVVGAVDAFAGDTPQFDDITMVVAKRK